MLERQMETYIALEAPPNLSASWRKELEEANLKLE